MDDKVYYLVDQLKKEIDNDSRFTILNELEKKMNDNEEVMRLAYQKDMASLKYNDYLKIYDDNHPLVIEARKELIAAKDRLNAHPAVKEYLQAYNEVRLLLYKVNDILFGDLKGESC